MSVLLLSLMNKTSHSATKGNSCLCHSLMVLHLTLIARQSSTSNSHETNQEADHFSSTRKQHRHAERRTIRISLSTDPQQPPREESFRREILGILHLYAAGCEFKGVGGDDAQFMWVQGALWIHDRQLPVYHSAWYENVFPVRGGSVLSGVPGHL